MAELENIYNLYIWGIVVLGEQHLGGESGGTCQVTRYAKQVTWIQGQEPALASTTGPVKTIMLSLEEFLIPWLEPSVRKIWFICMFQKALDCRVI